MDHMDGDHIVDVPDTPDRLANRAVNERSGVREGKNNLYMSCHSGKLEFFDEGTNNQPMLIDSRTKKLPSHPPNGNSSSGDTLRCSNHPAFIGGSTSSSRSTPIFRKGLADNNPSYESHDSIHILHVQNEKPSCTSKSTSSENGCFVDPTKRNVPSTLLGKAFSGGEPRSSQVDDFRKRPGLGNVPSSNNIAKFSMTSGEASERMENKYKVGTSIDDGERVEFVGNIQNKPGQYGFPALDPNSSPRITRQKRLVRNGYISPHNIAKAKQLAGKDDNGFVAVAHADTTSMASTGPPVWNDIKELVAEDHNSHRGKGKGKGVMNHPCSAKELDKKNKHLLSRNSLSINEKNMETTDNISSASKSTEKSSGWRSTHNRTRKMNLRSFDEEGFLSGEIDASQCARKHHENRLSRKEKGNSVVIDGDYHRHPDLVSSQPVSAQPVGETLSHPRPRLAKFNGHCSAANTLMKRQKQGSISISSGEGSTSANDDSEIVFLSSSGEPSNSRSISSGVSHLQPIIEIDDSPELKRDAYGEDARARQLEADEMLARELQEQFYNEMPVLGVGEVDEHIALALQQEESGRAVSRASNHALDPRDSLIANLRGQSHSRSSPNLSRRGSQARSSTSGRTTRFRGRFPGQPRTLSSPSRGRNSLFPASMDVDMRMHILETLEAFSDMGVDRSSLQIHRDFNETDYEMLLALDDNNDQHGGASTHLINGLPQSTVQNANFEEACAICLETPTIGDTIRHLPCLHKFHKDCIDPWLRRRTSCPVCKSSIT